MPEETLILVTGSWGFKGVSVEGHRFNACVALDNLWHLLHDNTSEDFRAAWVNAKFNCARDCFNALRPELASVEHGIVLPENWNTGAPTLFGTVGTYQFLSVVRTF